MAATYTTETDTPPTGRTLVIQRRVAPTLTDGMLNALRYCVEDGNGFVPAGRTATRKGSVRVFAASTLRALAARGLVTLDLTPDGGMGATITDAGRAALVLR